MTFYIQLLANGLSMGAVYAIIGVGFALIYSVLKFSNFSHGGAIVSCAYIAFLITRSVTKNLALVLILTCLAGGVINLAVEFICFRRLRKSGKQVLLYFVSSVTMGMLLENLVSIKFSSIFYSYPNFFKPRFINIAGYSLDMADLSMLVIAALAIGALVLILKRTRIGIAVRALSLDARATSLMGVNVDVVVMTTFFCAGVLAALAGVFVGMRTILSPQLGSMYITKGFIVAIIGGLGSLSGALVGALALGLVETILIAVIGSGLTPVGLFLFMMIFLAVRPQGIAGNMTVHKA